MSTLYGLEIHLTHQGGRSKNVRCVWVFDTDYQTRGSYGYATEAETKAAEDEELANIESGKWAALGCIVQRYCRNCDQWSEVDSLWGIVIEPDEKSLKRFARDNMDFEAKHKGKRS